MSLVIGTFLSSFLVAEAVQNSDDTNIEQPNTTASVSIRKVIDPADFLGELEEEDFSFQVSNVEGVIGVFDHEEVFELPEGEYEILELGPEQFEPDMWTVLWGGPYCESTLSEGDENAPASIPGKFIVTSSMVEKNNPDNPWNCSAENQYKPGTIQITKVIEGETELTFSDFSVTVNGGEPIVFGDDGTIDVDVPAGEYVIEEVEQGEFTTTYSNGDGRCEGVVANQENVQCEITNTFTADPDPIPGCTDPEANNYNSSATTDDGSCAYDEETPGCTDPQANNYNPLATTDDGSCDYGGGGGQCVDELQGGWVDEPIDSNQGTQKNGDAVLVSRSDTSSIAGAPDNDFFSLGFGGWVIMKFDKFVPDLDGDDISIHEVTNGRDTYPVEKVQVEVSQNNVDWSTLTEEATNKKTEGGEGVTLLDFSETGLAWIKYVRVTDTTDGSLHVPTADGFDLDAIDATQELCEKPDDNGGGGDDPEPTYKVFGYVWHDSNENDIWDGRESEEDEETPVEDDLDGWTVTITNGEKTYATTTDEMGYYEFYVPAGIWTISETVVQDWQQTFPNDAGVHVVEVIDETNDSETETALAPVNSFLASLLDMFLPAVALAQTPTTYGSYDFGNVFTGGGDDDDDGNGGCAGCGGGGARPPRCEFSIEGSGSAAKLVWETSYGRELWITANGEEIFRTTDEDEVDEGGFLYAVLADTDFELTVKRYSREETCQVSEGPSFGSGGSGPRPQVLGEQVSVVPIGAPHTGAGGAAPLSIPSPMPFVAALMSRSRNVSRK
ncbi:hypothetical protein H6778_00385 [Candidatus Nomurabacteria bacterium]|nr:hypothetical protein [Candidatus Nomurabacteria bacterium]